jgi:hypothetical protein
MSETRLDPPKTAVVDGGDDPPTSGRSLSRLFRLGQVPVAFLLTLYMLASGRWGSYISVPGLPVFIGDVLIILALVQVTYAIRTNRATLASLGYVQLLPLLAFSLLAFACLRMVTGFTFSQEALRDFAPYGYAVVAVLAALLPVRGGYGRVIYAVLSLHAFWVVLLPHVPGFPWNLPVLGLDAQVLVARPDFDSAVLGIAAAFALHDVLIRGGRATPWLVAFLALNAYGCFSLSTRAGFLAGLAAIAAVSLRWLLLPSSDGAQRKGHRSRRLLSVVAGMLLVAAVVSYTPTGGRLVDGITQSSSQASGTVAVRSSVWTKVSDYVFRNAERTAVGVGFGRNFIAESDSASELEGDTYKNVRSPHNYVVGTLARLGIAGALLATLVLLLGWVAAYRNLTRPDPVTALAAMIVIALPITALLGVILESPFGAIPYFWAIGQLARTDVVARS